jgi:hypothetical protein
MLHYLQCECSKNCGRAAGCGNRRGCAGRAEARPSDAGGSPMPPKPMTEEAGEAPGKTDTKDAPAAETSHKSHEPDDNSPDAGPRTDISVPQPEDSR